MKPAIVCGAGILSGKEVMALELGQGFRSSGHEPVYVTSLWGDGNFRQRLDSEGFRKYCMRLGFISMTPRLDCMLMTGDQLVRVPGLWLDYRRFLHQERPSCIIHTNWHHLLVLWPFLKKERDWFWLHEVVPDKSQYRSLFQRLARRVRGFIPVSHAVRKALLEIGVPEDRIQVIHNGIKDPAGSDPFRPKSRKGVRIGIVGQVAPWKGHRDLIDAFETLCPEHPAAELHIFGDDTQEFASQLKQRAERMGIGKRVVWRGFVADREMIYRELDICVVPSLAPDPLPTTAIEAACFALPVIASRSGGLPEIVEDGVTGFLFDGGEPAQLAKRLGQLLADVELSIRMGQAARKRAETCFASDRFVRDFLRLCAPSDSGSPNPGPRRLPIS